jgi:hypothetical protein
MLCWVLSLRGWDQPFPVRLPMGIKEITYGNWIEQTTDHEVVGSKINTQTKGCQVEKNQNLKGDAPWGRLGLSEVLALLFLFC